MNDCSAKEQNSGGFFSWIIFMPLAQLLFDQGRDAVFAHFLVFRS